MNLYTGNITVDESVVTQELGDEVVLLNMANDEYYGLNPVGSMMWKCLIREGNVQAAGDRLAKTYAANDSLIRRDLEALVRNLIGEGLLRLQGAAVPESIKPPHDPPRA